jgi:hypothetical protein
VGDLFRASCCHARCERPHTSAPHQGVVGWALWPSLPTPSTLSHDSRRASVGMSERDGLAVPWSSLSCTAALRTYSFLCWCSSTQRP